MNRSITFQTTEYPCREGCCSSSRVVYQTVGYSGAGGFGTVFQVLSSGKNVALKIYGYGDFDEFVKYEKIDSRFASNQTSEELWSRFFKEQHRNAERDIRGIKKLREPLEGFLNLTGNEEIIYVFDENIPERVYPAIEMPWAKGVPLRSLLCGNEGMSRTVCSNIFLHLLKIMVPFVKKGYIHGDLHPENILIDGNIAENKFKLTIIDYQTMQSEEPLPEHSVMSARIMAATSGWSFDPATHSAEVERRILSHEQRQKKDVFALGNILDAMLRGLEPLPGCPPGNIRRKRLMQGTPTVERKLIDLVVEMTELDDIDKRLSMKDVLERFMHITRDLQCRHSGKSRSFVMAIMLVLMAIISAYLTLSETKTKSPKPDVDDSQSESAPETAKEFPGEILPLPVLTLQEALSGKKNIDNSKKEVDSVFLGRTVTSNSIYDNNIAASEMLSDYAHENDFPLAGI